jgi:protein-tyrosine phosphatase
MIDIHSHILPGLDDGARTMKESLAMLRIAIESGTTDIVATPHANLDFTFRPDTISEKIEQLQAKVGDTPRIHRGCDFHLSFDNIQDAIENPTKYTINHRGYLLVEFSDLLIFNNTGEIFDRLLEAGMTPIITHPERNYLLHHRESELEDWAAKGVLMQVTALSFLGRFGRTAKRFAEMLTDRGLVQFVASDAHDPEDRTPAMVEAHRFVSNRYGADWANRLFVTNPGCTLEGKSIDRASEPPPRLKKWYRLWR